VPSGRAHTLRSVQRLRTLSEAECYARCYGARSDEAVRVVKATPRHADVAAASGELLRLLFEDKLDAREPEAA
jgi:hypothetical protein